MFRSVFITGLRYRMLRFLIVPGLGRFDSVIVVFVIHAGQYIGRR